jgi:Kdo2-lipid IVA lauroyltransferase/acyltransferase
MNKEKIEFLLFRIISKLFELIGLKSSRRFGAFLGFVFYHLIPIRKSVVIKNLSIAFPEKAAEEINLIARKNYQSIFITFFEFMCFPFMERDKLKSILTFQNTPEVLSAINEKKGLIFWSGHLGNWEVAAVSGSLNLGVPIHVMAKKQSNDSINDWLTKAREIQGNKMIWLGVSIRHLVQALRNGEVVAVVGDQRGPEHNPRIIFFGRPTSFYAGTATIIARTNCNVVLAAALRQKDENYLVHHEKLNLENLPEGFDERVNAMNQLYANFLEKIIRQYPEQYFWMHNLWKY